MGKKLVHQYEYFSCYPLGVDTSYKSGFIDSWGCGIWIIVVLCKQTGLPELNVGERAGGFACEHAEREGENAGKNAGGNAGKNAGGHSLLGETNGLPGITNI